MIYFFTVAAPPRSGTMWFSRVLTVDHSFCYHELSTLLHPYPSNISLNDWYKGQTPDYEFEQFQRRWLLQCYPDYFARLWERANFGQYIVGNSDSGTLEFLPALWLMHPEMKFIFSVRNGISCVQSHYNVKLESSQTEVLKWKQKWDSNDFFAICCHRWFDQIQTLNQSKSWLSNRAQCIEMRFEKVITDINELQTLWNWIGIGKWDEYADRNARLMQTPVNARTNKEGIVQTEEIWERWSSQQRETFKQICGDTMTQLSYNLPG